MTLEREEDGHTKALLNGIKEVTQYQQGLALGGKDHLPFNINSK